MLVISLLLGAPVLSAPDHVRNVSKSAQHPVVGRNFLAAGGGGQCTYVYIDAHLKTTNDCCYHSEDICRIGDTCCTGSGTSYASASSCAQYGRGRCTWVEGPEGPGVCMVDRISPAPVPAPPAPPPLPVDTPVIESASCTITDADLYMGTGTTVTTRAYTRALGYPCLNDDAGHILANSLGGSGTDPVQI
jgi:hypothetical protein